MSCKASDEFAADHSTPERKFLLAAGSAGIEAATNIVVRKAWIQMLILVYAAVIVLCFITFRSWRAVVVAVVPLVITSILCEALMVALGIGVKVATLPVIALGVGIGIDYALYLLSVQLAQQRLGVSLAEAYRRTLQFTGKVVVLVGVTLAAGVITWALSPIKFQADMGILLAFMFIWNMIGAIVLIPALSHFLLPSGSRAPLRVTAASAARSSALTKTITSRAPITDTPFSTRAPAAADAASVAVKWETARAKSAESCPYEGIKRRASVLSCQGQGCPVAIGGTPGRRFAV